MNIRFLCARHRAWLEQDPTAVESVWPRAYANAQRLQAEGNHEQALRHAGAAVEAAVIEIQHNAVTQVRVIERFAESCSVFLASLQQLQQVGSARQFLGAALQQLSDVMAAGAPRAAVMSACQRLTELEAFPDQHSAQSPGHYRLH